MLRWVAHQTEYDADAEACRLAVRVSRELDGVPQTLSESSRELSRALLKVSQQRSIARKSTWMHPSVLTRIQNMRSHPYPEAQERGLVAEAATRHYDRGSSSILSRRNQRCSCSTRERAGFCLPPIHLMRSELHTHADSESIPL